MIRRPPRSTQSRSSAASDVYKRQVLKGALCRDPARGDDDQAVDGGLHLTEQVAREQHGTAAVGEVTEQDAHPGDAVGIETVGGLVEDQRPGLADQRLADAEPVSYTHLRAH